jgi:S-DNA-T family DNA segregation ATPase FtsK/SpoIIIE
MTDSCDECHFEYASEDEASIPERLRTLSRRYGAPLTRFLPGEDGPELLRSHPLQGAWSALEYACHVRVERALAEARPTLDPMRREERVAELAYNEQDPVEVGAAVAANGDALAAAFEALSPDQWARRVVYSYPEPWERPLLWVGQHTVHELHHHLLDVGRTLRVARGR